jgi:hypothetical protein
MAALVKYAGSRDTGSPKPPQLEGEAAETVGAMWKSRRADTRLTLSAPSQLRWDERSPSAMEQRTAGFDAGLGALTNA